MTSKHLITFLLALSINSVYAQVGVGTLNPHPSATLEVASDTSGVLLTRMTKAQMEAINNPADGLLVYCTDSNDTGFFVYQNSGWQKVGPLSGSLCEVGMSNYHFDSNNMQSLNQQYAKGNMAMGDSSLYALTSGDYNIGLGYCALSDITTQSGNVAIGRYALEHNNPNVIFTFTSNTAIGHLAGRYDSTGVFNTLIGAHTGMFAVGSANTFLGTSAGSRVIGSNNIFIGNHAGLTAQTSSSTFIGNKAGRYEDRDSMLYIENSSDSVPLIGGSFANDIVGINMPASSLLSGATLQVGGDASKSTAGAWVANSDKRLKTNIQYMQAEQMLQKMLALKGATYEWNDTVTGIPRPEGIQYGFIAQDLEKVWPSKISKDSQGYLLTAYGDYDPMFVESIKALYQRITGLETEKQQLQCSLSQAEKEREDLRSEMDEIKSEREDLRNEIDDIKKLLWRLSAQQVQAQK